MGTTSQAVRQRGDLVSEALFERPERAAPVSLAPDVPVLPVRAESRIAVLTGDGLLAFAVTSLATAHFPAATVIRPDLADLRAARHFDSRGHALIVLDATLISALGQEVLGAWLRPFRATPILLLSQAPGVATLDHCRDVKSLPREITPRALAEAMRASLRRCENGSADRRQRPQEIDRITATQWRVIGFLGCGHSNKEIAFRMGISEATVKAHVGAAIARLGLTNRTEVALFAQRLAMGSRWAASAADVDAPL